MKVNEQGTNGGRHSGIVFPEDPTNPNLPPLPPQIGENKDIDILIDNIQINENLHEIFSSLNRLFLRRHPLHDKRFDGLNEDGVVICEIHDFSTGSEKTKINYVLTDKDGTQLLTFVGKTGFVGLNGNIIASYAGSGNTILGSVTQTTPCCCNLRPDCVVKDASDKQTCVIVDLNKSCILSLRRIRTAPNYEIRHRQGIPTPIGRIDERRLLITEATRKKGGYEAGRRSIQATTSSSRIENVMKKGSMLVVGRAGGGGSSLLDILPRQSGMIGRLSIASIGNGGGGSGLMLKPQEEEVVTEKPTHDHFCIAWKTKMNLETKLLTIGGHLLVNDDLVRRRKKVTRSCVSITLYSCIVLLIVFLAIGGILIYFFVL